MNPVSIAPMVGHTHRFGRYMLRMIAPNSDLFTEMLVNQAILRGDTNALLAFDPIEHPVHAQIAGSDPKTMALAAREVERKGFDSININVGCPSPKVKSGGFGACLFEEPKVVAEIVRAIKRETTLPISVKCRIGTENSRGYSDFLHFVSTVMSEGVSTFIVHARIAVLKGLTTNQNLNIPPLRYDVVHRLKQDLPNLRVILNGGLTTYDEVEKVMKWADGVMLGRLAVSNPRQLHAICQKVDSASGVYDPVALAYKYLAFVKRCDVKRVPCSILAQPLLNLFDGIPGAKRYRRSLNDVFNAKKSLFKGWSDAFDAITDDLATFAITSKIGYNS